MSENPREVLIWSKRCGLIPAENHWRPTWKPSAPMSLKNWKAVWGDLFTALSHRAGLNFRIGKHPVVLAYDRATSEIGRAVTEFGQLARDGRGDEARSRWQEGVESFEKILREFTDHARGLIGSAQEIVQGPGSGRPPRP
jgi:hypothetical protein